MTARVKGGPVRWSGDRDEQGHRTYKVIHLVYCQPTDGPLAVLTAAGLPLPGQTWQYFGETDLWAWCTPERKAKPKDERSGDPTTVWEVESNFTTKPRGQRCQDLDITDPLQEPQKVSGGFDLKTEEATEDRYGNPILNSAHERLRGRSLEFDVAQACVTIEQNVPNLQLELFGPMVNTLNKYPLWGLPPRCIRLTSAPWEKKQQGTCMFYFTRKLTFNAYVVKDPDGRLYGNWDKDERDEGTKVLNGHWEKSILTTGTGTKLFWQTDQVITGQEPSPLNPSHFIQYQDLNGNAVRTLLDGYGQPFNPDPGAIYWYDFGVNSPQEGRPPWGHDTGSGLSGFPGLQTTTLIEGGRLPYGQYYYKVSAGSSIGETTVPVGPSIITVAADGKQAVKVQWAVVPGAEYYCVYRNMDVEDAGDFALVATITGEKGEPGKLHIEKYDESDFALLGIPLDLEH